MTRVVYVGNFRAAPYTTENHVARSFRALGVDVLEYEQDLVGHDGPAGFAARMMTDRPDLVLYTRTHNRTALGASGWASEAWSDCWRRLEAQGALTASLHLDRFFDLAREHLVHDRDPLFTTQHVFTADGGNQARFAAAGVNHHWLPPAMVADECRRYEPYPGFPYDVVFVGSDMPYHAEYPQRGELLRFLRSKYGQRFGWYGPGRGPDHPVVRGEELGRVYASAPVVVGDSCFANEPGSPRSTKYWSDRIPESLGRGAVLVHPYVPGLCPLTEQWRDYDNDPRFHTGVHLTAYVPGDWDALAREVERLCGDYEMRESQRSAGRGLVGAFHTYTHRCAELLHVVGLRDSPSIEPEVSA